MTVRRKFKQKVAKGKVRIKKFFHSCVQNESGQGTTEYAILVGVLAVIAMIAIAAFRPALQTLWDNIQQSLQGLV